MSDTLRIRVNGDVCEIPASFTVTALLSHLGLPVNRVAIERNLDILPRDAWDKTTVSAGDSYEIVHLVGGG